MDRVVIVLAVAGIAGLYAHFWRFSAPGEDVEIKVAGDAVRHVHLSQDQIIKINGVLGESVLEIKDGKVRFLQSPCQGKVCIRSGWLSRGGEFAACLPNGISLYIPGGDEYDSINY